VTRAELEQLALLARLHLEPAELDQIASELGIVLAHFSELAAVDTTDVPAMTHAVPLDLRLRPDVALPSLSVDDALRAAPARAGDEFVVPAIIPGND